MPADPLSPSAIIARLRATGSVFAEEEAELLISSATDDDELQRMLTRRLDGQPLEHVVGFAVFDGLRVAVAPGVFVPRQRTTFLVDEATRLTSDGATVVDLCCGSGALGMALLARIPSLRLSAADIDPASVACARINLPTATVTQGDLFDALPTDLRGRVDVLVANTPYVPTDAIALMPPEARLHEPRAALDGGRDGLDIQRRVAVEAPEWLAAGGHVLVETSEEQADECVRIFTSAGLRARTEHSDARGATIVVATRATSGAGAP